MNDIEQRIRERGYQSPSRARQALARSTKLSKEQKQKLGLAIQVWEEEGSLKPPVVGALPPGDAEPEADVPARPSHAAEVVAAIVSTGPTVQLPLTLNLNAFIRARLTTFGVHVLYAARGKVPVPEDLLAKGGVWETTLAHFMVAFGDHLEGDIPVVGFEIELTRLRP